MIPIADWSQIQIEIGAEAETTSNICILGLSGDGEDYAISSLPLFCIPLSLNEFILRYTYTV